MSHSTSLAVMPSPLIIGDFGLVFSKVPCKFNATVFTLVFEHDVAYLDTHQNPEFVWCPGCFSKALLVHLFPDDPHPFHVFVNIKVIFATNDLELHIVLQQIANTKMDSAINMKTSMHKHASKGAQLNTIVFIKGECHISVQHKCEHLTQAMSQRNGSRRELGR